MRTGENNRLVLFHVHPGWGSISLWARIRDQSDALAQRLSSEDKIRLGKRVLKSTIEVNAEAFAQFDKHGFR